MSQKINNRKDILLLLLYSPGYSDSVNEPISGRTRLIKMLFLFKKEAIKKFKKNTSINEDNFYEFFAWNFGPFSKDVYDDLTFFENIDFVTRSDSESYTSPEDAAEFFEWVSQSDSDFEINEVSVDEYKEEIFSLTQKGIDFSRALFDGLSNEQKSLLKAFKARMNKASLRAVLQYVYENYEQYTEKSKIKDDILGG